MREIKILIIDILNFQSVSKKKHIRIINPPKSIIYDIICIYNIYIFRDSNLIYFERKKKLEQISI